MNPIIRINENDLRQMIKKSVIGVLNEMNELTAYHGSKVNFDRFDIRKVKSGYGACKYGNGVYVTVDKSLAAHYAVGQTGKVRTPDGIVYTVEIPDYNGENYILWNQPIGEKVYEKIKDYWENPYEPEEQNWITPQRTGEEIFNNTGPYWSSLSEYGIDGVQVPDTTKEHRIVNFIIFDDSKVKILKKEHATHDGIRVNLQDM